ncbi:helix-turn-helix domain-containing protein [Mucisphaera sp.]|uniref:helix-turn-helix domain-containing protein n=1 Tax=Mucisphaera sp. TaxID=2913024 RepID=UPI003D0E12C6
MTQQGEITRQLRAALSTDPHSLRSIARDIGCGHATLSRLRRGESNITIKVADALADRYGLKVTRTRKTIKRKEDA